MDAFAEFQFETSDMESFPILVSAPSHEEPDDTMKQLVDADTRLSYGGYCIVA